MAHTTKAFTLGNIAIAEIVFSSYIQGGETFTISEFGLTGSITGLWFIDLKDNTTGGNTAQAGLAEYEGNGIVTLRQGGIELPTTATLNWVGFVMIQCAVTDVSINITAGTLATGKAITNAQFPQGLVNFNTAAQNTGQLVAATPVYITSSSLNLPVNLVNGIVSGTALSWRIALTKNADGTGAVSVIFYAGIHGSTADTGILTQSLPSSTAVVDTMTLDILVVFTSTTTAFWSIIPVHQAASAAGFGVTTGTVYSGTLTGLSTSVTSLIFGIGIEAAAGGTMPTFVISQVKAQAYNLD